MKDSKGFSLIEGLLVLVLVGLLSFTGWYVMQAQHKTNSLYDSATKVASAPTAKSDAAKTANWTSYSSSAGEFSLRYPTSWSTGKNQANCPDLLMLGPTPQYAGACQTDATPEVAFTSISSDKRVNYELVKTYYPDLKKEAVTINGVSGDKYSGTLSTTQEIAIGPGNGTKSIAYIFLTNDRTYVATYNQSPSAPDVAADFNLIVTQTLKFHQ